jgi:cyclic beta-1,2-glucan glucanotransferase
VYHIAVRRAGAADHGAGVTLDGVEQPGGAISLVDDRQEHSVEVTIGSPAPVTKV